MLKTLISTEEGTKDSERFKHKDASTFHIRKPKLDINQVREYLEQLL